MSAAKQRRSKRISAERPSQPTTTALERAREILACPVDGSSLALFRICFAGAMVWHLAKQFSAIGSMSVIDFLYGKTPFNFSYPGFEWVQPWPQPWLSVHFAVVLLAAVLVCVGLFYRFASMTLLVGYSYIFLLDQSRYNNHYYLMCLLCFLLAFMPANRCFSIDAWRQFKRGLAWDPQIPFWPIFVLRFQLLVMYFFGGIAKLNADWLSGTPLAAQADVLQSNFNSFSGWELSATSIALFLAWGGLFYDLSVGFLLLWRRTRVPAILITLLFHLHNHLVFPIGVFPTLAFTATLIFLAPDWPLRFIGWITTKSRAAITPAANLLIPDSAGNLRSGNVLIGFVGCWMMFQIAMPLRHYLIEGDANWTEEGQDFSWRMMLRQKAAASVTFVLTDPQLQFIDERGNSQIRWDLWPDAPRAIHVPIESHQFNWSHHPGLTVTLEPCLGQRVIQRIAPGDETVSTAIKQKWKSLFGREPEAIESSIGLAEALTAIKHELHRADRKASESDVEIRKYLDATIETLGRISRTQANEQFFVEVTDFVDRLMHSSYGAVAAPHLRRVHPFALQGATVAGERFLVIRDSRIDDDQGAETLQKLAGDQPYLVWVDLGRLTPAAWKQLPRAFVSFESRQLRIIWNHFRELNRVQLDRFTVRPHMIHQYARHIADDWRADTGRRPEVRVHSSVMLNYKQPRSLINPTTDLAAVAYKRFGHNDWITPLETRPVAKLAQR